MPRVALIVTVVSAVWLSCGKPRSVELDGGTGGAAAGGATGGSGVGPGSGGARAETGGVAGTGGRSAGMGGTVVMGAGGAVATGGFPDVGSGGSLGTGGTTGGGGGGGGGGEGGGENKVVLFDGTADTFDGWASIFRPNLANPWRNNGDGTMTVLAGTGDIQSKTKFQSLFVHVEYMTRAVDASGPPLSEATRSDSGVLLKGSYEMQIVDTYGQAPAIDGCGAVHKVRAPLVTACLMGGQWNTYEIEFQAPVCDAQGQKTANARIVMATLNGTIVQQNVEVPSPTEGGQDETCNPAGLRLQDRASFAPIIYRNIWVIPRN